jgi:hypothetical protein
VAFAGKREEKREGKLRCRQGKTKRKENAKRERTKWVDKTTKVDADVMAVESGDSFLPGVVAKSNPEAHHQNTTLRTFTPLSALTYTPTHYTTTHPTGLRQARARCLL